MTTYRRLALRDALWDHLVDHPNGTIVGEMMAALDTDRQRVYRAVHDLRLFLAEDDTVTLTCSPQGMGEQWLYRLVGTYDLGRPWMLNRLLDMESRFETMAAVSQSLARGLDGRTVEGQKARLYHRGITRMQEDAAEIDGRLF